MVTIRVNGTTHRWTSRPTCRCCGHFATCSG